MLLHLEETRGREVIWLHALCNVVLVAGHFRVIVFKEELKLLIFYFLLPKERTNQGYTI